MKNPLNYLGKMIHSYTHTHKDKILYWYRYINNNVVCFNLPRKYNKKTTFLDFTLAKIINRHKFSILYKPSNTDRKPHNSINYPIQDKLTAYCTII